MMKVTVMVMMMMLMIMMLMMMMLTNDAADLQQPVELCDQWVAMLRLDTHKIPRHWK